MKKWISFVLLAVLLLSCCACGKQAPAAAATQPTQAPETATLDPMSNEAKFGHIDQTVPQDGVYQIWNAEGVKGMAEHPDANFEFCAISIWRVPPWHPSVNLPAS